MEACSGRKSARLQSESDCDHIKTDSPQLHDSEDGFGADQQLQVDSDSFRPVQQSTSPSSTLIHADRSDSPVQSHMGAETTQTQDDNQANSALFTQLELLHQECQEKEALINKLGEQLADWEELHAQLQEKERLNCQYIEALQAAESTIAYLTACSLDNQGGFGSQSTSCSGSGGTDAALHSRCMELQKALQDKEDLNNQLMQLLNMAERVISSSDSQEKPPEITDLCFKIETVLQQGDASSDKHSQRGVFGGTEDSVHELQRHADSLQEALWEQNKLNAVLQERLRAADTAAQHGYVGADQNASFLTQEAESLNEKESKEHCRAMGTSKHVSLNQEMNKVLSSCLSAAESTIASLAAHCKNTSSIVSGRSSHTSPDLQMHLDKLQRALQEREELVGLADPSIKSSSNPSSASSGAKTLHLELHHNISLLCKLFSDHSRRICELQASLQEERGHREQSEAHTSVQDSKGLPPNVQVQLETLHKALREKKKACKSLEEKLATAQSLITETPSTKPVQKGKNNTCRAAFMMYCVHKLFES